MTFLEFVSCRVDCDTEAATGFRNAIGVLCLLLAFPLV